MSPHLACMGSGQTGRACCRKLVAELRDDVIVFDFYSTYFVNAVRLLCPWDSVLQLSVKAVL